MPSNPSYPLSDHYDGKKFFNPENRFAPPFTDMLKLMANMKYDKWPDDLSIKHKPQLAADVARGHAKVTFVNHATLLIQLHGLTILTDPVWSERVSPFTWAGPKRRREPGVPLENLPHIDVILVSHNHYDHTDIATLKKLCSKFSPRIIVPLGDKILFEKHGLTNVQEHDWWDTITLNDDSKIVFTPCQHFSARGLFDRNSSLWGAYMILHEGLKIYFGGDTGYSSHFKQTRERLGAPDIALLPIGAYKPRWFMQMVHMDPAEAVQAHLDLAAKKSIAIHFGTFALTQESPEEAVSELYIAMEKQAVSKQDFLVMGEGETALF
jgi:L-ascorbate metabolism protein UlaG (beta-lactamase superfamily)